MLRRSAILMYHSIAETEVDPWHLHVSPSNFEAQLQVIKNEFVPLSLEDCVRRYEQRQMPPRCVVLTFDDGYVNNYTLALPLLEQYGIPATFFIVSGAVDADREFWWDELEQLILLAPEKPGREELESAGLPVPAINKNGREELYLALWQELQPWESGKRSETLLQLASAMEYDLKVRPSHRPVTGDELRRLAASPLVTIGAHTVRHPKLTELKTGVQEKEIQESKQRLEQLLRRDISLFSYPFGAYDDETPAIVKRSGLSYACSTEERVMAHSDDPLLLPRIHIDNWPGSQFKNKLMRQFHNA